MIYDVSKLNATKIVIGRRGENLSTTIKIDVSAWLAEWPSASLHVVVMRPGDTAPYVASTSVSTGVLSWPVTNVDTENAGKGKIEVRASSGNVMKKSVTATIEIEPCIMCDDDAEPPELDPALADQAIAAAERAENAAQAAETARWNNPRNLLDNSWFVNPINQRGASAYGGTAYMYSIDRWILPNAKVSVVMGSDGIAVTNNDSDPRTIMQRTTVLNGYNGSITFAVCLTDGTILCASCVIDSSSVTERQHLWSVGDKNVGAALYDDGAGYRGVGIIIKANATVNLRWAALYEGAYTAETLPTYQYKCYAVELAECQRYYVRFTSDVDAMFLPGGSNHNTFYSTLHLPVPMRIDSPTVKFENVNLYAYTAGSAITINQLTAPSNSATHGFVTLRAAHDTDAIAAGAPGCMRILAGGYIDLSADL